MGMRAPNEMLLQDMQTMIEWTDGNNGMMGVQTGLNTIPGGTMKSAAMDEAYLFCENLTFATHADWTVPTAAQAQEMINFAPLDGFMPVYADGMTQQIIGYTADMNDIKTVTTQNNMPKGMMQDWSNSMTDVKCTRTFLSMAQMQMMIDMMQQMADNNTPRFDRVDMGMDMPMGMRAPNEMLLRDAFTNLEWTGGNNGMMGVKTGMTTVTADTVGMAKTFCEDLTFGTHTDWRLPNAAEAEEMVKGMQMSGMTPVYTNMNSTLMVATGRNDMHYVHVNTHNMAPAGETGLLNAEMGMEVKCIRTLMPMMGGSSSSSSSMMGGSSSSSSSMMDNSSSSSSSMMMMQ